VTLDWTGGIGPFAVQEKTDLNDSFWVSRVFTGNRTVMGVPQVSAAYFRVGDTAHQPAIPFTMHMSGLMERPTPLMNSARGSGTFSLEGNALTFSIEYSGLSGPATAAHIHGPATAAESVGVMLNLAPYNGTGFGVEGVLAGTVVLTAEQAAIVLSGRAYVNVHTMMNSGGEVRGQIAPVLMRATLSGAKERPNAVETGGFGSGVLQLTGKELTFDLTYGGLSSLAVNAHIHGPATEDEPAGVLVGLASLNGGAFGQAGSLSGTVTLTEQQLAYVLDGLTYINIHTMMNSGGEVRGQILPQAAGVPLSMFMSGLMERPTPLTNSASGSGSFSLEGDRLHFDIRYAGLSGAATAAHIHGPAPAGQPAGVMVNLAPFNGGAFGVQGALSGSVTLTPEQTAAVLAGQTYVNVHTMANTGGEVRGQVVPVLMGTSLSGANERPTAISTPGTGAGVLTLVRDRLGFNVHYRDLTSMATASHIHGPASVFQSADVLVNLAAFTGSGFGVSGSLFGSVQLAPEILAQVIDGMTYINIHTSNHTGGEIRGQISR
jgi:hypothetical protein